MLFLTTLGKFLGWNSLHLRLSNALSWIFFVTAYITLFSVCEAFCCQTPRKLSRWNSLHPAPHNAFAFSTRPPGYFHIETLSVLHRAMLFHYLVVMLFSTMLPENSYAEALFILCHVTPQFSLPLSYVNNLSLSLSFTLSFCSLTVHPAHNLLIFSPSSFLYCRNNFSWSIFLHSSWKISPLKRMSPCTA